MGMIISLAEARTRLGDGVAICLEPQAVIDTKTAAGKQAELWVFDPVTGRSRRGDNRFFTVEMVDRGGWHQPALREEPGLAPVADGTPPVIGYVFVDVNPRGYLRTKTEKGLSGPVLQLPLGSVSNQKTPQPAPDDGLRGYVEANPQRLMGGRIAVYFRRSEFPDDEGMLPGEFKALSTDGRSLAALAKCGW